MKLVVAQIGARMHYAIPRMLYEKGMLEHFYTDICAVKGWPRALNYLPLSVRNDGIKRLLGRVPNGVPNSHITAFTTFGWSLSTRLRRIKNRAEIFDALMWANQEFCKNVLSHGLKNATGIYTFNGAGLELMKYARKHGVKTVMEQTIAPMEYERKLLAEENYSHPGWQEPEPDNVHVQQYISREKAEWAEADLILCGSEFVREGIAACGGPLDRCLVVPYGVDWSAPPRTSNENFKARPLRVLTVGAVGLRKGSPYVFEAAKLLKDKATFRMVGTIDISRKIAEQIARDIDLLGPVPRSEIYQHFNWADVFLLPSVCEGSATVTYEALAAGLPVICTPNTGSVVRDGIEGFCVKNCSVSEIVSALEVFISHPSKLEELSRNARERASEYTLEGYQSRLIAALTAR